MPFEAVKYARVPKFWNRTVISKFKSPWKGKVSRWRIIGDPMENGKWRCPKMVPLFSDPLGKVAPLKVVPLFLGWPLFRCGNGATFSRYQMVQLFRRSKWLFSRTVMFRTFDVILNNSNQGNTKNLMYWSIISIYRFLLCIDLRSGLGMELEWIDPWAVGVGVN